ncbi:hypothetical protein TB1_003643 [Malus domestica]
MCLLLRIQRNQGALRSCSFSSTTIVKLSVQTSRPHRPPGRAGPVFDPSLFKPSNQAKVSLRVQSPNAASLPTSFISNKSIELTQDANSVLKSSIVRSRTRIMMSSTQVVDQPSSQTGHVAPAVVDVNLGNQSYSIYVRSGLLEQAELRQRHEGDGSQKDSTVSQQIEGWRRHNNQSSSRLHLHHLLPHWLLFCFQSGLHSQLQLR